MVVRVVFPDEQNRLLWGTPLIWGAINIVVTQGC